jgi:hypothetical protein
VEGGKSRVGVAEGIGGGVCSVGGTETKVLLEVGWVCAVRKVVADDVDELELAGSVLLIMTWTRL